MMCKEMTTTFSRIINILVGWGYPTSQSNCHLASPVKLICCGLSPFYKIGPMWSIRTHTETQQSKIGGCIQSDLGNKINELQMFPHSLLGTLTALFQLCLFSASFCPSSIPVNLPD